MSRLVCFVVYLSSIAAAPARRACSPASPDELFLGRHLILSEDLAFVLWRSSAPPCQVGRYVRMITIIILLYPGKVHRFGQIMSVVCSFPPPWGVTLARWLERSILGIIYINPLRMGAWVEVSPT